LIGTTLSGGNGNRGTVFSMDTDGSNFQVLHSFKGGAGDGAQPLAGVTLVGSKLFGTTDSGGSLGDGTVFSMDTNGSNFQVLYSFTNGTDDGGFPHSRLIADGSTLYGVTTDGGANHGGTLFSIDTDGDNFQVVFSFTAAHPMASNGYDMGLTLVGSTLYGATTGNYGADGGTVFSIDTGGNNYQVLHAFSNATTDGFQPYAKLTVAGSTLYGTTYAGGSDTVGTVFSIDTDGNNFQLLHSFTFTNDDSYLPAAGLTLVGSTLYGTAAAGSGSAQGAVFSIDTSGDNFQFVHTFTGVNGEGATPYAGLTLVSSTLLGTTTGGGGSDAQGTVFSLNANGSNYQILHSFTGGGYEGSNPATPLIASGTTLYGTTPSQGRYGSGTVFSVDADSSNFQILHSFGSVNSDGYNTHSGLTLVGSTLFGMTTGGGAGIHGIIFSLNTDGSNYQILHSFTGNADDGGTPFDSLIALGSTLYGTTYGGGSNDLGTIFSIDTQGNNFQVLHSFAGGTSDGDNPFGGLTLVGSTLYGTTYGGGAADKGTIFSIDTSGTGYQVLHSFTGGSSDGANPGFIELSQSGSTLFGTTIAGGSNNHGTFFSIDTDGNNFQLLHSFTGGTTEGSGPLGTLIFVGPALYGTTSAGGSNDLGIIFSIDTQGNNFQILHSFAGGVDDGYQPNAGLASIDANLYGTTYSGGIALSGVVFALSLDTDPPTSSVSSLPQYETSSSFTLSWSGQDNEGGSGLAGFDIYVSDNGGSYTLWKHESATTLSDTFDGQDGHSYGFYSVATDNAGNLEAAPSDAQATTIVDTSAPSSSVNSISSPQDSAHIHLSWSGADGVTGSGIDTFNIFVSVDGGSYSELLHQTADTSASFDGLYGHTYSFYSVATDHAGNVEAAPGTPDATVAISDFENHVLFDAGTGIVRVGGTTASDTIVVARNSSGKNLQVTINGHTVAVPGNPLLTAVHQIRIFGRDGGDTVTVTNLAKTVYVEGGSGADNLIVNGHATANAFNLNGADLTVNGALYSLDTLEKLAVNGGDQNDTFTVSALPDFAAITGALKFNGGAEADTLVGQNEYNTWSITGVGAGAVTTGAKKLAFSNFENLTGGSQADDFVFAAGKKISGKINGGAGANVLDYSAYTTAVTVICKPELRPPRPASPTVPTLRRAHRPKIHSLAPNPAARGTLPAQIPAPSAAQRSRISIASKTLLPARAAIISCSTMPAA
jgi:uncharacterized repeat protein (TIGR03803 family)